MNAARHLPSARKSIGIASRIRWVSQWVAVCVALGSLTSAVADTGRPVIERHSYLETTGSHAIPIEYVVFCLARQLLVQEIRRRLPAVCRRAPAVRSRRHGHPHPAGSGSLRKHRRSGPILGKMVGFSGKSQSFMPQFNVLLGLVLNPMQRRQKFEDMDSLLSFLISRSSN